MAVASAAKVKLCQEPPPSFSLQTRPSALSSVLLVQPKSNLLPVTQLGTINKLAVKSALALPTTAALLSSAAHELCDAAAGEYFLTAAFANVNGKPKKVVFVLKASRTEEGFLRDIEDLSGQFVRHSITPSDLGTKHLPYLNIAFMQNGTGKDVAQLAHQLVLFSRNSWYSVSFGLYSPPHDVSNTAKTTNTSPPYDYKIDVISTYSVHASPTTDAALLAMLPSLSPVLAIRTSTTASAAATANSAVSGSTSHSNMHCLDMINGWCNADKFFDPARSLQLHSRLFKLLLQSPIIAFPSRHTELIDLIVELAPIADASRVSTAKARFLLDQARTSALASGRAQQWINEFSRATSASTIRGVLSKQEGAEAADAARAKSASELPVPKKRRF